MSRAFRRAHREMWAYLKQFPDAKATEIAALRKWIKDGNSPYENGDGVCDDRCHPMDFIATLRFWDDVYQEFQDDPDSFAERWLSNDTNNFPTDIEDSGNEGLPIFIGISEIS